MRPAMVVEADPVPDCAGSVLYAVEALAMNALLLQGSDDALDHAILLRAVRRDELLLEAIAADQRRELLAGKNKAVVRSQQEFLRDATQRTEPVD